MTEKTKKSEAPRDNTGAFIVGIIITIIVIIGLCGGVPILISTYFFEDTRAISGDASHYDPFAALPDVQDYAGDDAQLISISAQYVGSDGTMDLTADYYASVDYEFFRPAVGDPDSSVPLGVSGSQAVSGYQRVTIRVWQPNQLRQVTSTNASYQYLHLGMAREISAPTQEKYGESIGAPRCTTQQLWEAAIGQDAPRQAVAIIDYTSEGYRFRINDTNIALNFDLDCELR